MRKSIEKGRSFDEIGNALDELRSVEKELSVELRKSLRYYKRKYRNMLSPGNTSSQ